MAIVRNPILFLRNNNLGVIDTCYAGLEVAERLAASHSRLGPHSGTVHIYRSTKRFDIGTLICTYVNGKKAS